MTNERVVRHFEIEELEPIPPGNPYLSDAVRMGSSIGTNLETMHTTYSDEVCDNVVIVEKDNGIRLRIHIVEGAGPNIILVKHYRFEYTDGDIVFMDGFNPSDALIRNGYRGNITENIEVILDVETNKVIYTKKY